MGFYFVELLGGAVYWIITGLKKDKNECVDYKYSFEIGILTIILGILIYLYL
jgi:hypothetical protein